MRRNIFIALLVFSITLQGQTITNLEFEEELPSTEQSDPELTSQMSQPSDFEKIPTKARINRVDRLLKRADAYFNKMWYAEAAELYDKALERDPSKQTLELLQKAGDAHYFSGNMKKAHHWYALLFDRYQDQVSEANVLKYAHVLKGIGRYGKAKRLVRVLEGNSAKPVDSASKEQETGAGSKIITGSFKIKNLDFNSPYSDFSPMLLDDGRMVFASAKDSLFFNTRRYKWNNQPYLDLYIGQWDTAKASLQNIKKFSKNINSKYHEAAVSFSPDKQTLYFTRNNYGKKLKRDKRGINHLKIYRSRKVEGEWSKAVELPFNSEAYSCGHPAVSPDGKKLYFVSDMPGGFGKTDIYVVSILENGRFSPPKNLGRGLNTPEKEMFPFVTENSIYFSSDRAFGFGGLDIYKANYTNNVFDVATNMGQPLNSNRDDFSFIVGKGTDRGYFASNRKGGKGDDDIYAFEYIPVKPPKNNTLIKGTVTDLITGALLSNVMVSLADESNNEIRKIVTGADGRFVFDEVLKNNTYTITSKSVAHFENVSTVATEDKTQTELDIVMKRIDDMITIEEGQKKLKTDLIYFDFDKSNITVAAAKELDKLVGVWEKYPNMVIKIESHTDSRGKASYNQQLSDKRAKASRDYLISKGISPDRIVSAKGYGEERLLNDCVYGTPCSSKQHRLNRRSEFIIVSL